MSRGGSKSGQPGEPTLWPAQSTEVRALAKIRLRDTNPNKHTLEQIEQIAASMRKFGWTIPVLIDEADTVLAGHGRVRAARLMGWTDAPVVIARGWTEDDKRAYVIADNQLARNSEWDAKMLRSELRALQAAEFDMQLIGISDADLQKFTFDAPQKTASESTEPEDVHLKRCPTCGSLKRQIKGDGKQ